MKSKLNKLTYPILGLRAIDYISNAVSKLNTDNIFFVLGNHNKDTELPGNSLKIIQEVPRGTGDAIRCFLEKTSSLSEDLLIMPGDIPLITSDGLKSFYDFYKQNQQSVCVLTTIVKDPSGYGRIIRADDDSVTNIIEHKDCSEQQININEINTGIYLIKSSIIKQLVAKIDKNNSQGEFYLTDIIKYSKDAGLKTGAFCNTQSDDFLGINNPYELSQAISILKMRKNRSLMLNGVIIEDPENTFIDWNVNIDAGSIIYSGCNIKGDSSIGSYCKIGPNAHIIDSNILDNSIVINSMIEKSNIGLDCKIGPFSHIRPESIIKDYCKVGNFVEVKKSTFEDGVKASHLSYIGDAFIGKESNIGCGTITCNYDGKNKHKTEIGEGSFIGSNTCLVAPVKLGKNVFTGAGSVITKDIPDDSLGIARGRQANIKNWSKKRKTKEK